MKKQEKAIGYFNNSFNCSQSVFSPFATEYGISTDDSLKIACAFGGGMGRQQYTCGAVTGALMALGLKYGKALHDDESKKKETYAKVNEFFKKFMKENGSLNCRELLDGLDMNNETDLAKIQELGLFENKCPKYVTAAVTITEELMKEK